MVKSLFLASMIFLSTQSAFAATFAGKFRGSINRVYTESDPSAMQSRFPVRIAIDLKVREKNGRIYGTAGGKTFRFRKSGSSLATATQTVKKRYDGVLCQEDRLWQLERAKKVMTVLQTRAGVCAEADGSESEYEMTYGGEWRR